MNRVQSSIVIDATPEECFAAATGFEVDAPVRARDRMTAQSTHARANTNVRAHTNTGLPQVGGRNEEGQGHQAAGRCVCVYTCVRVRVRAWFCVSVRAIELARVDASPRSYMGAISYRSGHTGGVDDGDSESRRSPCFQVHIRVCTYV